MNAYERNKAFRLWKVKKARLERLGQLDEFTKRSLLAEIEPLLRWATRHSPEAVQIQFEEYRLRGKR